MAPASELGHPLLTELMKANEHMYKEIQKLKDKIKELNEKIKKLENENL